MKKKYLGLFLSAFVMLSTILTGCNAAQGGGSDTLVVGVRDDIMNFGYLNDLTGNYYGFEIDLAKEIANELGYKDVELVSVLPENRKQTLLDGEVDCLIAAYTISDTRLENFDFSPAYYTDKMKVMVQDSSLITEFGQLEGKTIGVMSGANSGPLLGIKMQEDGMVKGEIEETEEQFICDNGSVFQKIPSYEELSEALEIGTVDAICLDESIGNTYMNDDRMYLDTVVTEQQYGVATQKDSELSKKMAEAVQKLLDNGTVEKLQDKWN